MTEGVVTACNDGIDNDLDGDVDWIEDATCDFGPDGTTERVLTACNDGVDNDCC